MLAGGIPDPVLLEDARDLAEIQVYLRRHVPPDRWVDDLVADAKQAALDSYGAC